MGNLQNKAEMGLILLRITLPARRPGA